MQLEMKCTCHISGIQEAEERRERIFLRMGLSSTEDLTTAIVLSLAFDFQADAEIDADQWFGISLTSPLLDESIWVECDWPLDGLAACWEVLAERFPERATSAVVVDQDQRQAAQATVKGLLKAFAQADGAYRQHRDQEHPNPADDWCPTCRELGAVSIDTHTALDEAWGSDSLNPAIDAIFNR